MEVSVVAETEEVEFEALTFHHTLVGQVADAYLCKVRLAGDGAETGELGTVELYPVVVLRMLVGECFKHLGCVVGLVLGLAA